MIESLYDCAFVDSAKGSACSVCGFRLPADFAIAPRRTCDVQAPCRHLLLAIGAQATVSCTCPSGAKSIAEFEIHLCAISAHRECLPAFRCSAANKTAVRETWTRSDGGDAYQLIDCHTCRATGAGFEAVDSPGPTVE